MASIGAQSVLTRRLPFLLGEPPQVYERIGPAFTALVSQHRPDPARPGIEFYRARDEIDVF
jgi:hypothetical protein